MTRRHVGLAAIVFSLTATASFARWLAPGSPAIAWLTVDAGGGTSSGGNLAISGTIGQHDANGAMASGSLALAGGFWFSPSVPQPLCPPDIAPPGPPQGDGLVNVDDLLAVINAWGLCANPDSCPADISPSGGNDIVNVDDLLAVINAWGVCAN